MTVDSGDRDYYSPEEKRRFLEEARPKPSGLEEFRGRIGEALGNVFGSVSRRLFSL
jgi:hypothetical protein